MTTPAVKVVQGNSVTVRVTLVDDQQRPAAVADGTVCQLVAVRGTHRIEQEGTTAAGVVSFPLDGTQTSVEPGRYVGDVQATVGVEQTVNTERFYLDVVASIA